jgi:hypothetical protein
MANGSSYKAWSSAGWLDHVILLLHCQKPETDSVVHDKNRSWCGWLFQKARNAGEHCWDICVKPWVRSISSQRASRIIGIAEDIRVFINHLLSLSWCVRNPDHHSEESWCLLVPIERDSPLQAGVS